MRGGPRSRRRLHSGRWGVTARVERFSEPAVLLLLRERPAHGYELLEQLGELTGETRVDMGNLYRVLRALELEGIVTSDWSDGKRTYELTESGNALLDQWASSLREAQGVIAAFLKRYDAGKEVTDART
jgi:PadR family transcriptional regulator, regulatory protein PadR